MRDDDNNPGSREEQLQPNPADNWPSRDDLFRDPEQSEEFEEPDRDSDYASVYTEVDEEEPELPDEARDSQLDAGTEPTPWDEEQPGGSWDDDPWENEPPEPEPARPGEQDTWAALSALRDEEQDFDIQPEETGETWAEDSYDSDEEREVTLPLGIIAVGIVALVLLGAGGYGVMQDRAAMQEQIRQLQASLATAATPAEVAETRANSEALVSRNTELEQQVAELSRENRSLQSIIGGLETQLQAQQEALAKSKTAPPAPQKPASKPAPKPKANTSPANPAAGTWFVNFGSYSQRSTAQNWVGRLNPAAGDVVVSTGEKDGRTFYRVRVINLASEEVANQTARKLEQEHDLSRLWVGRAR